MLGKHVTIVVGRMLILALIVATANTGRAAAASGVDPFQTSLNDSMPTATEGLNLSFTVPAGKTLVIEYVSGNCFVPAVRRVFSRSLPKSTAPRPGLSSTCQPPASEPSVAEMCCGGSASRYCSTPMAVRP
jgi:hypothetical protein